MFKLEINTDNASFYNPDTGDEDKFYEGVEINRLLSKIQKEIEEGCVYGVIMDINGNKVGKWSR